MSILKKTFGKEKRWVNYQIKTLKGKKTKIPYAVTGRMASSTDEKDWSMYDVAKKASANIGIVFTPAQDLLGIDIDHCINKETNAIQHEEGDKIAELLLEANTYTEISPSGEGLHLFLSLTDPLDLSSNKRAPFEAYTSGRYFTVTEQIYGKEARPVRRVSSKEALEILSIIGYPWKKNNDESEKGKEIVVHKSTELSTHSVMTLMFKSKNGRDIQALYEGDVSKYMKNGKPDLSSADMALCSHLAFWTKKDPVQMEAIWLGSPLGNREKTQERKDYRVRTVQNAIAACKEVYEPVAIRMEKELTKVGLDLMTVINDKGAKVFVQNTENVSRILRSHPEFSNKLRYDTYRNIYEFMPKNKWLPLEDNDTVIIQTRISILFPMFSRIGKEMVRDAIIKISKENTIDSGADFIKSIKWDGVARLDDWLHYTYGVAQDPYHTAVASNWIKGLVKRLIEPGSKFDYVLVLEGPQGSKKSSSLYVLGENIGHVETTMSTDTKDFFMQMSGKAIVEFSEGETLSRTEVKKMKAIITMQNDRYRVPYERITQDFPRRCVFGMTTNQDEYLKDETGNRRWWPIKLVFDQADLEWLKANKDQLFAEAYHRLYVKNENTYEVPKEETEKQQAARQVTDPNAELIGNWYFNTLSQYDRDLGITVHQVFSQALGNLFGSKELKKHQEMNITRILKDYLKLERRQTMIAGFRATRWFESLQTLHRTPDQEIEAFMASGD